MNHSVGFLAKACLLATGTLANLNTLSSHRLGSAKEGPPFVSDAVARKALWLSSQMVVALSLPRLPESQALSWTVLCSYHAVVVFHVGLGGGAAILRMEDKYRGTILPLLLCIPLMTIFTVSL